MSRLLLSWVLSVCWLIGCNRSAPVSSATPDSPPSAALAAPAEESAVTETGSTPERNPYHLADDALARLKAGDALPGRPADLRVAADAKIRGLYFQNGGKSIAALIRPAEAGEPALWLDIQRAKGGGFELASVRETPMDPDLSVEVEGL